MGRYIASLRERRFFNQRGVEEAREYVIGYVFISV